MRSALDLRKSLANFGPASMRRMLPVISPILKACSSGGSFWISAYWFFNSFPTLPTRSEIICPLVLPSEYFAMASLARPTAAFTSSRNFVSNAYVQRNFGASQRMNFALSSTAFPAQYTTQPPMYATFLSDSNFRSFNIKAVSDSGASNFAPDKASKRTFWDSKTANS